MPVPQKINGTRIYLRALTSEDATPTYCEWLNNTEVNQFLETRYIKQTVESIKKFIDDKNQSSDEWLFGIYLISNDRHIGNIKLGPVRSPHKLIDVSLFIGEVKEWGKGYASEAISLVTKYAFDILDMNKLIASMYLEARGSTKAFIKANWILEATLKDHYIHDGEPMDLVIVGISKNKYLTLKNK